MAITFTWREILTVTVGEMSRTRALECTRHFDAISPLFTEKDGTIRYNELMSEFDLLAVMYAPSTVKLKGEVIGEGEQTIRYDDESFRLVLPLTREIVVALPMSLCQAWIGAAVEANGWIVDTLKKAWSLTLPKEPEPKSGNAPLREPMPTLQTTPTIGN